MPGQCVVGFDRDSFYDDIDRKIEPSSPGLGVVSEAPAQIAVRSGPQFVEHCTRLRSQGVGGLEQKGRVGRVRAALLLQGVAQHLGEHSHSSG